MSKTAVVEYSLTVDTRDGSLKLEKVGDSFDQLGDRGERAARRSSKGMDDLFGRMMSLNQAAELARKAFHLFSLPLEKIISVGSKFEDIQLQLETVLGSASEAQKYFEWIQNFANTTPFKMEGLTEAVIMLESFGIKGQEYLRTFGDVAAGLKVPLNDLSRIMGQIYAKPTAQAEEMLQLIERGIPVQRILQKELGLTAAQVGNIGREGIEGTKVFEALARGMQSMYGGAMEKMSKNMSGLLSTLSDKFELFIGRIAGPVLENLKGKLEGLLEKIDQWAADGTLEKTANDIADFISNAIDSIAKVGEFLWKYRDEIISFVKIMATLWVVDKISKFGQKVTGLIGNLSSGIKTLKGGLGGLSGILSKLPLLAGAAFVGWKVGEVINDVLGLTKATAQIYEWEMKLEYARSARKTGLTEATLANAEYNQQIREIGKSLGENSNSILRNSTAILNNKKAFEKLTPELQALVLQYTKGHEKAIEHTKVQKEQALVNEEARKGEEALRIAKEEALKAQELQTKKIQEFADKLKLTNTYQKEIEEKTRLLTSAVMIAEPKWYKNAEAMEAVGKVVEELLNQYSTAGIEIPETLKKIKTAIKLAKSEQEAWNQITKKSDKTFKAVAGTLKTDVVIKKEFQENTDLARQSLESASEMADTFSYKIDVLCGNMQEFGNFIIETTDALSYMGLISENTANGLTLLGGGISEIGKGVENLLFNSKSIFDYFSNGLTVVTGVFSVMSSIMSLFGGDGVGEAIDREREMIYITEEMEDRIRELEKTTGDTHTAISKLMSEILSTANVNLKNFDSYAQRTRDILADLDRGTLSIGETQEAIGKAFNELLAHAERLGTEGSKKMIELISDVRSRGLEVAEIWDYCNKKILQGVDALEIYLGTFSDTGAIQQEIAEIQGKLAAGNLEVEEASQLTEQLIQKQEELFQTTADIVQNWEFIQSSTASLFHSLESQGYGFVEIVQMMGSHFDTIADMAVNNGLQVSEGLQAMLNMSNFIRQHEDLANRIEATRQMMEGLGDSAFMTQTDFTNFSNQTLLQFEEIMKLTGDEEMALRLLAPALSDLIKYQEAYNLTIDEKTQKLIENARQEGFLQKETMSGQEKIVSLLEVITVKLGADIPYALQGLTVQATDSIDRIAIKTGFWEGSLDDVQDKMTSIMGTMDDLDRKNTQIISGNTITEQVRLWWNSLNEVEKKYYKGLYDGIYDFHKNHGIVVKEVTEEIKNKWIAALEEIEAQMRYAHPDALDLLQQKYDWVMKQMQNSTETLYLSQDGVLRTYHEMLQMNAELQNFDFSNYGIYSQQQREGNTTRFLAMENAWNRYQDIILSNSDWINSFLSDLQNMRSTMVDEFMNAEFLSFLQQVETQVILSGESITEQIHLWWQSLDDVERKYYEGLGESIQNLNENHGIVIGAVNDQVKNLWLAALEEIEEEIRCAHPEAMDLLLQKYDFIMQQMVNSTETLYLSQDGVLQTYHEMLQMNAKIQSFDFSSFGIFSDQQMEDITTKFLAMKDTFEGNMNRILSDPDWANSFLRNLKALKGGMVDDVYNDDYLLFLSQVEQKIKEIQPDVKKTKYSPKYRSYSPPSTTSPVPQTQVQTITPKIDLNIDDLVKELINKAINLKIYNLYFPKGTSTRDMEDFRRMFLEVLQDNPDGFTEKVSVILKEY